MTTKRSWTFALVVAVALGLVTACGSSDEVRSDSGPTAQETTVPDRGSDTTGGEPETTTTTTEAPSAQPATSPLLAVTGTVQIPDGEDGKLSVVLVGQPDASDPSGTVPVVVRNRTEDTVYSVEASGTARASDGSLSGSGSSQGFAPSTVAPGEWAFGYLYFSNELPADATFEVTATGESDAGFIGSVDVRPVEVNQVPGEYSALQVVGIVANETDAQVEGPISVAVACFDGAGTTVTGVHTSYTDADSVAAGGTTSFSVDLFDTDCPNFAVGASGYDF